MSSSGHDGQPLPPVALLGLGTMGRGMTHSLLRAGFTVHVWDRTSDRATELAKGGATAHENAADAVRQADVVITMVADAAAVDGVAFGQGVLAAMRPSSVWAQMSTVGVAATMRLAERTAAERPDVRFADAPVSGTRQPAETGQLLILASGPDEARPVADPVFAALGQRTLWLGAAGAGSRLKLVMNTWLVMLVEGTAEILALADSLGLPHEQVLSFLAEGSLSSPVAQAKGRKMDAADDSPDFSLQWALKDVNLAMQDSGLPLPLVETIRRRWTELVRQGLGGLDVAAARHGLAEPAQAG